MNRLNKISMLGNVLLAVVVLWLVQRMHGTAESPPPATVNEVTNTQPDAPVQPVPVAAAPKPFRWSQLESTNDYRIYVSNLRAIGCPERIIRAIVQMDVNKAFALKRQELRLDGTGTGPWSQREETNLVASLMGDPPMIADTAAAAPTATAPETKPPWLNTRSKPAMPLVFQPVDPNVLQLTDSQKQVIEQLQQRFINEIGGSNQDPNDPAYLARWQKAQPEINDMLRGYLGSRFYLNYRRQVAEQAAATPP